jgi:hypothetical protein
LDNSSLHYQLKQQAGYNRANNPQGCIACKYIRLYQRSNSRQQGWRNIDETSKESLVLLNHKDYILIIDFGRTIWPYRFGFPLRTLIPPNKFDIFKAGLRLR